MSGTMSTRSALECLVTVALVGMFGCASPPPPARPTSTTAPGPAATVAAKAPAADAPATPDAPPTAPAATPGVRRPAEGQDLEDLWNEPEWKELTPTEKALWKRLGWTEAKWQEEEDPPPSEDRMWDELTDDERAAAAKLGYTKAYWDDVTDAQERPTDQEPNETF